MKLSTLSNREWTQIRAALRFWNQIAVVSSTHPSTHPAVEEEFTEHGPMNVSEIETLLDNTPQHAWLTAQKLANAYGVSRHVVLKRIEKAGIQPDMIVGKTGVYRVETLMLVAEELENESIKTK